ncbi:MAG TPA: ATP-dependent DNA helicase [Terriglobales bacterium]|nr:ATP-dependent DNA helicase [Terriglobales bacterium]
MASSKTISVPAAFIPDEHQRAAIEHVHGPMLVVAGAGTGKTTVLTRRIARLVQEGHARPDEILALTYTENAASEMRERVQKELGAKVSIQAMTFHGYCFRLLDKCGKKFSILDDKDLWIFLRKRIRDLGLKYFVRAANVSKFLDDLLEFMRRCQDELVGPERYAAYVEKLNCGQLSLPRVAKSKDALGDEELLGRCQEIARVYTNVERFLAAQNLGTFGHMITRAHAALREDSQLVLRQRARARFVLVDEFQDANFAQVKILERLAGEDRNIFAVGDPDQAIYRFRGASSAAFGLFQLHFPGAKLVSLAKNQRSLAPILRCAYSVISHNPAFLPATTNRSLRYQRRPLFSAREEAGPVQLPSARVEAVFWRDCQLEAADVVGTIRKKQRQLRCSWDRFAVIYRNHFHRDEIVAELSRCGIPYSIEGMDVLDVSEVRDLLACLGCVVSLSDSASLFRVVAFPHFKVRPEGLRAAMKAAPREVPLAVVLGNVAGGEEVLAKIQQMREHLQRTALRAHGALRQLMRFFDLPDTPAVRAVLHFVECWEQKPVTESGSIGELLEYLEYFREAHGTIPLTTEARDAVRLMTAHAAKGLEFDHVFIIRAHSPSFPLPYREPLFEFPRELRDEMSVSERDDKKLNDQEERRLFYVAMTRARDSLAIYAKQGKGKDSSPPGFVRELLADRDIDGSFVRRNARPMQVDLFAGEAQETPATNLAAWLALSPAILTTSLSATAIELYKTCPLQFKLEREWRIPGETPAAMRYGASIHRALRTYCDAVRFERDFSEEELLAYFRADLHESKIEDPYQQELYERQGVQQLHDFVESWKKLPVPEILDTEKEFKLRIGPASIAGRIDRMDQVSDSRVVIIDYKTGKPRSQEDADESLQLSLYAIAARECWVKNPERLVFYNLETNAAVATTRSELQLEEIKAQVENVAQSIASGNFDPTPGFHCGFCAYRRLCPATEKQLFPAMRAKKTPDFKIQ